MSNKFNIVVFLIVILTLFALGSNHLTGFFSTDYVNHTVTIYRCSFQIDSNISDQNLTVGQKLYLDINHTESPSSNSSYVYSDDTSLFDIDSVTGEINYTVFSSDVGVYLITLRVTGYCQPSTTNFTLTVTPAIIPPGEGGGTTCQPDLVYGMWGPCFNGVQQRTVEDQNDCRETTTQERFCTSSGGSSISCSFDGDCPEGFFCPTSGVCRQEPPSSCGDNTCDLNEDCENCAVDCGECVAELMELPSLPSSDVIAFLNYDIIEYPGYPTELKAIRAGEITPTGMLDLSGYNLYYESVETPLGIWLRKLLFDIYTSFLGK